MIDLEKTKQVLSAYKKDFKANWDNENYKWKAIKCFQDNWNIDATDFGKMFEEATRGAKNLLSSARFFAQKVIIEFSRGDNNATRRMFQALYDESKDLSIRVNDFMSTAKEMWAKYGAGEKKNNFQEPNAISVYLWLRYPDKYYIYMYGLSKDASEELKGEFPYTNKVERMIAGYNLYDEIREIMKTDNEMRSLLQQSLTIDCYNDPELVTTTGDFVYYLVKRYPEKNGWFPIDYTPELSVHDWEELLKDQSVVTDHSLQILARIKDIGGLATCKQLSAKYGEDVNFYNSGSSSLAKRVAAKTECRIYETEDEQRKWWPILYIGRQAKKSEGGGFLWKMRPELQEALDNADLSSIKLYANSKPIRTENSMMSNEWGIPLEFNTIFYGPPGTGKTYALLEKYAKRYFVSETQPSHNSELNLKKKGFMAS